MTTFFFLVVLEVFTLNISYFLFHILYFWYILCISVIFFLKATIRACDEPGVSCSEFMFLLSYCAISVILNK